MDNQTPQEIIETEIADALQMSQELVEAENELMQDERFLRFLKLQKEVPAQIDEVWKRVETKMIDNNIKSIKGDWGSITVAERLNWDVDVDQLPAKFFKKVVDTTKLSATYKLEQKDIKGATPRYTKYLTKRIK